MPSHGVFTRLVIAAGLLVSAAIGSRVQAQESEAATRQYAVAVGFQNMKEYETAVDEWRTFIRKFPKDPRLDKAHHYLGTCLLQDKQFKPAADAFAVVISKYRKFKDLDQSLLNQGIALYGVAQGTKKPTDYALASKALTRMLSDFPRSQYRARALFYQGESLYAQEQLLQAARAYADLIARYPRHEVVADATYALGVTQEAMKQSTQARATYARFASTFPKHELMSEVRYRQAELLFNDGEFAQARPLFETVRQDGGFEKADVAMLREARCLYELERFDQAGRLYWNMTRQFKNTKHFDTAVLAGAKCFFLDGKYALARSGLETVAKRDVPEAAEAVQWIARTYLKEDQPQDAVELLDRAITRFRTSPTLPELQLARIDALYDLDDDATSRKKVAQQYASFATSNPKHELAAQAQYMSALSALEGEDHAAAKRFSDRFLDAFEDDALSADVLFIAAESRMLLGEYQDAQSRYRRFLSADGKHKNADQARVRLGLAMHLAGDHDASVTWLTRVQPQLQDESLKSEAMSLIGRGYAAQEKFDQAAQALLRSFVADPDRKEGDETLLALADAYRKLGRSSDASEQLQKVISQFPASTLLDEAHFRLGEIAFGAEQFERALSYYQQVVSKWPKGEFASHAQYGLGWTQFSLGEYQAAVASMTKLSQQFGNAEIAPKGLYVRAMANYQLGEHQATLSDVAAFLKTQPKKSDALDARYVEGLAHAGLADFEKAAETYSAILEAGAYEAADKVAYELGWAYTELGKTDDAVAAFRRLARDWPESPLAAESLFRVGESYYDAERFEEAAAAYADAQKKSVTAEIGEKSLHKLGWSYLKREDYDEAASAFTQQLTAYQNGELSGDAQFLVGECRFKQEEFRVALTSYGKVIAAKNPNYHALALYRSGECSASLEDWKASQAFHEKVLDGFSNFEMLAEARYGLGWALQNQGQIPAAVREYERVTEETQTETAAKARFMIGECYFAQKKHKEAIKHFLKAAFGYGHKEWSAMAYFEAARCYEVLRDVAQARKSYQQLIEKYPKHRKVADAKRRLAALGG